MLGRLLKHEFKSYGFSMGIIYLAGGLMVLFMKILSMLPYNDNARDGIQMLMAFGFVMVAFLINVAVQVIIVMRFYITTASDQAYLTWTLPAKTSTIIWSKLLGGLFWKLICMAAIAVLGIIFYTGSYWLWHESISGMFINGELTPGMMINGILSQLTDSVSSKDIAGFIMYYIGTFVWSIAGLLLMYMCIGLGQLFGKYRVVATIGFYFLFVIVVQVISTIGVAVLSNISFRTGNSDEVLMGRYGFLPSIVSLVAALIANVILFVITNILFDKHLNID